MTGKIGVAIIGSGIFVKEEHLPAVLASSDLTLKALYSRTLKSAQDLSTNDIDLYSSDSSKTYSDLLSRKDIQAVIIALPIPNQPDYIKQALAAGKHVLAEKPIAKDVETARELIAWYHQNVDTSKVTLGIAEQFRYLAAFLHGAKKVKEFGRVLGCRTRMQTCIQPGSKYYETSWRKTPEYQGGFLLDGGVHFIAGMRLLLGGGFDEGARVERVSAFTKQLQDYLPPVDTVDSVWRLSNGNSGTFSVSFGTTFSGAEWTVACEGGSVSVNGNKVISRAKGGEEETEEVPDEFGGVKQEVFAWAGSLVKGKQDPQQGPEEALADLEVLEMMLRSGERGGEPMGLKHQV